MDILIALLVIFIFFTAFLLLRTLRLQGRSPAVDTISPMDIHEAQIAHHLSEAIQIRSISKVDAADEDQQPFIEMRNWIKKTYPLLSSELEEMVINKYSLLFKWKGTENKLDPVLFNAHMDVVPVEEETIKVWNSAPFRGEIKGGYVWGRGTLDMKNQLIALLEAVEELLKEGFIPKRTIYLSFGHDEEIMGFNGANQIADQLKSKGIKLAAVLDEGGMLTQGMLDGVDEPVGLVGITEKGYLTLDLSVRGKPGHSSTPPRQTAVGVIARALALMDDNPMPARLDFILPTLQNIANLLPFWLQLVIANAWLFKPILLNQLAKAAQMNAMIRTTHAATMIEGGIKDNILPALASAKVNCRLLPGDSVQDVIDHFKKVIGDPRVVISIDKKNGGWGASGVSPTDTPAYLSLDLVIRQVFDNVAVAPFTFLAATDSRYYQPICKNIYKFSPILMTPEDRSGIHGVNERIRVDGLGKMVVFFTRLMKVWGEAEF
ncbi:MAG: M20 family peptidase [Anaerolineaceae bacterium]|nr:M20 family peptidase [Anaerolineaceae bacterium]